MLSNISVSELQKIINDVKIIDIRSVESFNNNHIPNAHNIPMDVLMSNPAKYLEYNKIYYIYCQKGIRSVKVCDTLRKKGYRVVNIIGGYESWILEK